MDVITIESKAYHELMGKIEKILRYVEKEEKAKTEYENRLVTNDELADILGISKRTLQRMRSADRISYKIIYGRCYYALHDIEEAIRNKSLYCNPQNLFECDDNITDYIFGLTTNTFSARDGGSPSIEGCVAEILCPLLSNGLSV